MLYEISFCLSKLTACRCVLHRSGSFERKRRFRHGKGARIALGTRRIFDPGHGDVFCAGLRSGEHIRRRGCPRRQPEGDASGGTAARLASTPGRRRKGHTGPLRGFGNGSENGQRGPCHKGAPVLLRPAESEGFRGRSKGLRERARETSGRGAEKTAKDFRGRARQDAQTQGRDDSTADPGGLGPAFFPDVPS